MRQSALHIFLAWVSITVFLSAPMASSSAHADWVADLKSPITEAPARWTLIGGTATTLVVLATDYDVAAPLEKSTARRKPLGSASKIGDVMGQMLPNALYAGGTAVAEWAGWSSKGYDLALTMVEATAYAATVTTILKYSIREGRPYDSSVRNSFPSGHSTTAFAFAGVVAAEHGWWYGVPAMGLASFVAYSRLNDHQHYLKDVVAGATVGLSCSLGIAYAHQRAALGSAEGSVGATDLLVRPVVLPDGFELAADWSF